MSAVEFLLPLTTLAAVQLLAVISPGQSFVVVSKLALSGGRAGAVSASLGMGFGSVIWAGAAIAGLALVLEHAALLYAALKLAGGVYLLVLAFTLWRRAPRAVALEDGATGQVSLGAAFVLGLFTQLANPKVVVFFGSIFFALLPADAPLWVYAASIAIVFCNETLWYSTVSLAFSLRRPRSAYQRAKLWIDRVMALALGAIGAKLVTDAFDAVAARR